MAEDDPTASALTLRRPSRRAVTLVSIPLIGLVLAGYVGDALAPSLVDRHPALLIALNPRNRNLALVTNELDATSYYGIGFFRLVIGDPLFFLLGYWYGDAAVVWMERRTQTWGGMLRQVERWFAKAAYPLVFVAPNAYICLFAGAAGMPLAVFAVLNVTGSVARLWLVRVFGRTFESPIDAVVDWIGDNRVVLLVVSVGLVLVSIALEARSGETEVGSLARLEDELEEADEHRRHAGPPEPDGTG